MGKMYENWQPSWWNDNHGNAWERVKEALKRDWEQTKKDLHAGGKNLGQNVDDTVAQAAGAVPMPGPNQNNPAHVIGNWDDVEMPLGYGYGARAQYGAQHPTWNNEIEGKLRTEWDGSKASRKWDEVKSYVRRGYEYPR